MTSAIRLHGFRVYVALPWLTADPLCLILNPPYSPSRTEIGVAENNPEFILLHYRVFLHCSALAFPSTVSSEGHQVPWFKWRCSCSHLCSPLKRTRTALCLFFLKKWLVPTLLEKQQPAPVLFPLVCFFRVALVCSCIYLINFLLERNSRTAFAN